jgi:hypothetical protein
MTYGIYENGKVIARFTAPLTVRSNQPISVSDTLSLKRQIAKRGAQRWEITSNLEPLGLDAADLFVNLVTKGFSNTEVVTIVMPQNYASKQNRTANTGLAAYGSQYATQLTVSGFGSGIVPKGTFIRFANHPKIYMMTSNLEVNGALNIFPGLVTNVGSIGSPVAFTYRDDVFMDCYYDTDVVKGMVYSDGILMDTGTVTLIEKL